MEIKRGVCREETRDYLDWRIFDLKYEFNDFTKEFDEKESEDSRFNSWDKTIIIDEQIITMNSEDENDREGEIMNLRMNTSKSHKSLSRRSPTQNTPVMKQ